ALRRLFPTLSALGLGRLWALAAVPTLAVALWGSAGHFHERRQYATGPGGRPRSWRPGPATSSGTAARPRGRLDDAAPHPGRHADPKSGRFCPRPWPWSLDRRRGDAALRRRLHHAVPVAPSPCYATNDLPAPRVWHHCAGRRMDSGGGVLATGSVSTAYFGAAERE